MLNFSKRSTELEIMDSPERVSREDFSGCLEGLERVNRWLRGAALAQRYTGRLINRAAAAGSKPVRICDVGTGSADIPRRLIKWARRKKLSVHITAVEQNSILAKEARRRCRDFPEITVIEGDAREILRAAASHGADEGIQKPQRQGALAPPGRFDIVTASLFLHHFPPEEAAAWIGLMDSASTAGWVVNDLERRPLAWLGIKLAGPVLSRNRVFLHDGPLSVRRAYTPREWVGIARKAGVRSARLSRHWPARCIIWREKKVKHPERS